jgi:chemotaxis response regulator CheB
MTLRTMGDMRALLIAHGSPVRERLARAISELPDILVEIQEPGDAEVCRTILRLQPDVVLIDIEQTNGLGLQMIRQIHGLRGQKTPVIMAFALSASLHYRAVCHEAGATYYFDVLHEQDWLLESLESVRGQLGEQTG